MKPSVASAVSPSKAMVEVQRLADHGDNLQARRTDKPLGHGFRDGGPTTSGSWSQRMQDRAFRTVEICWSESVARLHDSTTCICRSVMELNHDQAAARPRRAPSADRPDRTPGGFTVDTPSPGYRSRPCTPTAALAAGPVQEAPPPWDQPRSFATGAARPCPVTRVATAASRTAGSLSGDHRHMEERGRCSFPASRTVPGFSSRPRSRRWRWPRP